MKKRVNAGYVITDSIHIGESEVVLGFHATAPAPYVTWECSNGNSYYWGHYFSNQLAAKQDLIKRAQTKIRLYQQKHDGLSEKKNAREEYER